MLHKTARHADRVRRARREAQTGQKSNFEPFHPRRARHGLGWPWHGASPSNTRILEGENTLRARFRLRSRYAPDGKRSGRVLVVDAKKGYAPSRRGAERTGRPPQAENEPSAGCGSDEPFDG